MPIPKRTAAPVFSRSGELGRPEAAAERLRQFVDAALAATIVVAPLFMGGRGPVGKLVFTSLVAAAAIGWGLRLCCLREAKYRWSGAEGLILAGLLLVISQLFPLPGHLLRAVSPGISELLPLWQASPDQVVQVGTWSTLSVTPMETRGGLAMFFAYALLFTVLVQRLDTREDIEYWLKWLAAAVLIMAAIGMLQFLFGNGKFLWIYDHPSRDTLGKVNGTFQNQNHLAHFLGLGVGPLIWWMQQCSTGRGGTKFRSGQHGSSGGYAGLALPVLAIGLGLVLLATLLTFSRGGVICVGVAAGLSVALLSRQGLLGRRAWYAAGVLACVLVVAVTIYGSERLSMRLGTLLSGSLGDVARVRMDLWRAQWKAIPRFFLLGGGVGSHRAIYPVYMEEYHDVDFAFGENGYFQLLLETGVVGLATLLTGFGLALRWCAVPLFTRGGSQRLAALAAVITPGVLISLLHSWGDFVWYIPACVSVTLLLLASACRLGQLARQRASEEASSTPVGRAARPREPLTSLSGTAAIGMAALAAICGSAAVSVQVPAARGAAHWDAYRRLSLSPAPVGSSASEAQERLQHIEQALESVLRHDPAHARAQLTMASVKLQRFDAQQQHAENPLILSQIRDAALASAFPSRAAQDDWLRVAVGSNRGLLDAALRHTRAALRLSPLQGLGYVFLAELSFLETPREQAKLELIQQAVRVRPHDGRVLFAMGQEAALRGDMLQAIQQWRKAFRQDPEVKQLIIDSLATQLPAELFLAGFDPDLHGLRLLFAHYCRNSLDAHARTVSARLISGLEEEAARVPSQAARVWHELQNVYTSLGEPQQALRCQQKAVELAPQDFAQRKTLALLLVRGEQFAAALPELEWCLRRHPEDQELQQHLAETNLRQAQAARQGSPNRSSSPSHY